VDYPAEIITTVAAPARSASPAHTATLWAMARVVVDVVLKPEILDPQGQAILGALGRLGIEGVNAVRQGKHFELDVDDGVDDETITKLADTLLANPVIEDFTISH
jgi:phosphoribosylformylglycinamidine synthase subunit PurS